MQGDTDSHSDSDANIDIVTEFSIINVNDELDNDDQENVRNDLYEEPIQKSIKSFILGQFKLQAK